MTYNRFSTPVSLQSSKKLHSSLSLFKRQPEQTKSFVIKSELDIKIKCCIISTLNSSSERRADYTYQLFDNKPHIISQYNINGSVVIYLGYDILSLTTTQRPQLPYLYQLSIYHFIISSPPILVNLRYVIVYTYSL